MANPKQFQTLKPIETLYPFELVSLDTGKIMLPSRQEGIFLIAIDHFTWWVEVNIVPQETSIAIETFVKDYILYCHKCPKRIQTDGGKLYISQIIMKFFAEYNIKYTITEPYYP